VRKEVIGMEQARKLDVRPLLLVLAVAFAAAAIWAATALAGGGWRSTSTAATPRDTPAYEFVQTQDGSATPSAEDCPERDADSSDSGTATSSADA
jgi:hypothetical protein